MDSILLKSASFVFIILLAYLLKRWGLFHKQDYKIATKMALNVTLPAAIVTSFASYEADISLLLCSAIGLGMNWLALGVAFVASKKRSTTDRALWLNSLPGYNIGSFALPFAQSFLSPASVVACCLFDSGSAIMCTGGTYALSCGILGGESRLSLKQIGKNLLTSVPFLSYGIMMIVALMRIPIPQVFLDFISPLARANPFMAMFMLGLMFDIRLEKEKLADIVKILLIRVGLALLASAGCFYLLPLPLEIRQALAIAVFAPVSVASTALAEKAGADASEAGCLNSLSIPVSIVAILALLTVFGVM